MALFSGLSEKLNHIFSKLTKHGRLTELEIKTAMREVRIALLEADVSYKVVKDFTAKVSARAVGASRCGVSDIHSMNVSSPAGSPSKDAA